MEEKSYVLFLWVEAILLLFKLNKPFSNPEDVLKKCTTLQTKLLS